MPLVGRYQRRPQDLMRSTSIEQPNSLDPTFRTVQSPFGKGESYGGSPPQFLGPAIFNPGALNLDGQGGIDLEGTVTVY